MEYLGLIGNVERSILDVEFGNGFHTEEMKLTEFAQICEKEFGIEGVWDKLHYEWGYCQKDEECTPQHVYVVKKSLPDFPQTSGRPKDAMLWREQLQMEQEYEEKVSAYVENKTRLLRLLCKGSIQLSFEMFYNTSSDGSKELISSREQTQTCENRLFTIHQKELQQFSHLDCEELLSDLPTYLKFSWDNFEHSYEIPNLEFEFVCLMTSLEALLNDGESKQKCSITTGIAVLVAQNSQDAQNLVSKLKELYEIRALLLDTGDKTAITGETVVELKDIVRRSLIKALELKLPKADLINVLLESDFAQLAPLN